MTSKTEFYYMDDDVTQPFTAPHNSGKATPVEELLKLGVLYFQYPELEQVNELAKQRHYKNRDHIELSKEKIPEDVLNEKLKIFYEEHLHEDEEIRYIVDGEGYFDVRDLQDRWIRCKVVANDLLILPEGIYHRFTLTDKFYVKAIRLFQDEPKWIAINRAELDKGGEIARQQYLASVSA
ncbi:unnamed protein product [Ambrosiozyma monospora]|uniref:Acireductone dioxygenase n=1 Tax=Ambrosiozyma monospora TaxID=43982 RepID=A0A9W7DJX0_AMBMO|nr:unnamed protein product [Ambrosiozyma monospora]